MMRFFLLFPFLQTLAFGQFNCNAELKKYCGDANTWINAEYIISNQSELECLIIRPSFFESESYLQDCWSELDFANFTSLKRISIGFGETDSLFQSKFLNQLAQLKTIEQIIVGTTYLHDFSGFEKLRTVHVNRWNIDNHSLFTSPTIEELLINADGIKISSEHPLFELTGVNRVFITNSSSSEFPFHGLYRLGGLKILIIDKKIDSVSLNSINRIKQLEELYLGNSPIDLGMINPDSLTSLKIIDVAGLYEAPIISEKLLECSSVHTRISVRINNGYPISKRKYKRRTKLLVQYFNTSVNKYGRSARLEGYDPKNPKQGYISLQIW